MSHLSHVHLPASDLARSIAFYRDRLGLHLGYQSETMADVDQAGIVLDQADAAVTSCGVTVGLRVDNVDEAYAQLRARGAPTDSPPKDQPWGVRNFYLNDPDGHTIEYEQPTTDRS
jgi:catechol 2,3-dioxygenase-like lactoylglutathione lyase family enzyme